MLDALNPRHHKAMSQGKAISPSVKMKIRGLTLMEVMVTVAIMAILLVLAVPSFNAFLARGRLTGAAEALAQDLQLAKSEALRRNAEVRFSFSPGSPWCYGSIASSTACNCTTAGACTLRQVDGSAYAGVTMAMPNPTFAGNTAIFTARPEWGKPHLHVSPRKRLTVASSRSRRFLRGSRKFELQWTKRN